MKITKVLAGCIVLTTALAAVVPSAASDLIYQPINPSFGGSPSNAGWLMEGASIQNQYKSSLGSSSGSVGTQTPAQEFAATLQRRLLFAVSDAIVGKLSSAAPGETGEFTVEGTVISYNRIGNELHLTIFDGVNSTSIVIPAGF